MYLEVSKLTGALHYVPAIKLAKPQNVYWHLDRYGDEQVGRAVFHYDASEVGSNSVGLFGANGVSLSDLAMEAFVRLGQPYFLPNATQLGALIRAEHTVTFHCKGIPRKSGDEATEHPAGVYGAAVRLHIRDYELLVLCKIHDLVEDIRNVTIETVERSFGSRVSRLEDGMTKYRHASYREHQEKFLAITAIEPFLPVVKLLDVSQNLTTVLRVPDVAWQIRWLLKTLGPTRQILIAARPLIARQSAEALTLFDYLFESSMSKAGELYRGLQHPRLVFA